MPFEFDQFRKSDQDKIHDRIRRFWAASPFNNTHAAAAWNGVIDFLLNDEHGQFIAVVIASKIRSNLGIIKMDFKDGMPQVILVGNDKGLKGELGEIVSVYGVSGLERDFTVQTYTPGDPNIVRDATAYFKRFLNLYYGQRPELPLQSGSEDGKPSKAPVEA